MFFDLLLQLLQLCVGGGPHLLLPENTILILNRQGKHRRKDRRWQESEKKLKTILESFDLEVLVLCIKEQLYPSRILATKHDRILSLTWEEKYGNEVVVLNEIIRSHMDAYIF